MEDKTTEGLKKILGIIKDCCFRSRGIFHMEVMNSKIFLKNQHQEVIKLIDICFKEGYIEYKKSSGFTPQKIQISEKGKKLLNVK